MTTSEGPGDGGGDDTVGLAVHPNRVLAVLLAAGVVFSLSQTLVLPALPGVAQVGVAARARQRQAAGRGGEPTTPPFSR